VISGFLAWGLTPAFAFGEFFDGSVGANIRVSAVDSSSYALLMTAAGTVASNTIIKGTHFLLDDGNFRTAGGSWIGITEYVGYIRAPSQEGRCYRATFDAFYPPDPRIYFIAVSPTVCVPFHSPDCGHCGPGTGMPCVEDTQEVPE
jgi:hypothetical protein